MRVVQKLIVFTDLDGSLLDHHNYQWQAADPAINQLQQLNFPVIINSSKTGAEIKQLRKQMSLQTPFICENGAVIHYNHNITDLSIDQSQTKLFAEPYQKIQHILRNLQLKHSYQFTGFADMTTEQLIQSTGLDRVSANAALQREATEPLQWQDSEAKLEYFKIELAKQNLQLTQGGRFYHVMSPVNKGDAIQYIIKQYQQAEPSTDWLTAGLGDSINDIPMLEQVDYPVLINNPDGNKPDISHIDNLLITEEPGPAGWNSAIFKILHNITGKDNG